MANSLNPQLASFYAYPEKAAAVSFIESTAYVTSPAELYYPRVIN